MDDNHDNFMADTISSGTNTIATFTDEECSQADMYLKIPPNEDDAARVEDTTANIEDNSRNNEESLVNESIDYSHEVYIYIYIIYCNTRKFHHNKILMATRFSSYFLRI
jgi:hypothetical protein